MGSAELIAASVHPRTVAFIDCFADERDMYAHFLTVRGYRVVACDGAIAADALDMVSTTVPDAIVLRDDRRPGQNAAVQLLQRLHEAYPAPVLVLTTDIDPAKWKRVRDLGAAAVFLLPLAPDDLAAALGRLIELRRTRDASAS